MDKNQIVPEQKNETSKETEPKMKSKKVKYFWCRGAFVFFVVYFYPIFL